MTGLVIDASSAVGMTFPDEALSEQEMAMVADNLVWAPPLLPFEYLNAVVMAERRKRFATSVVARLLANFAALNIVIDHDAHEDTILSLARRHRLTAYDAAYLELALRRRVPLLTRDSALGAAARAEGVVAPL